MPTERRRQVTDVRALRALANPVRYRIFGHLMAFGSQTASECAAVVGATPSNCSYHLRELARFGLVERVDDGAADGRERPWRTTATGFSYPAAEGGSRRSGRPSREPRPPPCRHRRRRRAGPRGGRATRDPVPGLAAGRGVGHLRAPDHARGDGRPGPGRRRPHPPVHRPDARRPAAGCRAGARPVPRVPAPGVVVTATTGERPATGPSPLRNPSFARLWLGGLVSDLGDWMLLIGLPVFVFQLTGSALTTATVFVVETVPALLAGQVAGVLVDRVDRRRILIAGTLLQAILLLPLLAVIDGRRPVDRLSRCRRPVRAGPGLRPGDARPGAEPGRARPARLGERAERGEPEHRPARRRAARRPRGRARAA